MRWLHLSDLHFGYHTATVTAMRSKLLALAEKEGPVDCLFITGDLRFAKRSPTAYPEDTLPFLRKLQEALGVDGGSTFLVPGNHDVNRCEELTALLARAGETYRTSDGTIRQETLEYIRSRRTPFLQLYEQLRGEAEPAWHYCVPKDGVNIICLNTALLSCRNGEDGALVVGSGLLNGLAGAVDPTRPGIVLAHHDFDSLRQEERQQLEIALKDMGAVLYLCGHKHVALCREERTYRADQPLYVYVCGAGVDKDANLECPDMDVFFGEMEPEGRRGCVMAYKWSRRHADWMPDEEFSYPQGRSTDGRRFFPAPVPDQPAPAESAAPEVLEQYRQYIQRQCSQIDLNGLPTNMEDVARQYELERIFVPLSFQRFREEGRPEDRAFRLAAEDAEPEQTGAGKLSLKEFIPAQGSFHAFLLSDPGGGKTTLLKWLASAYCFPERYPPEQTGLPARALFPIWIRCRDIPEGSRPTIWQTIGQIAGLGEWMPNGFTARDFAGLVAARIQDGSALLLIDGLDEIGSEGDRQHFVEQLRVFVDNYPQANVLVTSRPTGFSVVTQGLFKEFKILEICKLEKEEVTDLCCKWYAVAYGKEGEVRRRAENLAQRITEDERIFRLASNPLMLTTLLLVERRVGRLPNKRAVLYHEAIQVLLESWNRVGHKHQDLDLDEAEYQLAYVAFQMMTDHTQRITRRRLKGLLQAVRRDHSDLISGREPIGEFVRCIEGRSALLIQKGLTKLDNGQEEEVYEFQHLTFQEYLAAYAVVEHCYPGEKEGLPGAVLNQYLTDDSMQEVIALTAAQDRFCAKNLTEALLSKLEGEEHPFDELAQLRALLLQVVADEAQLTDALVEKIFTACFRHSVWFEDIQPIRQILEGRHAEALRKFFTRADQERNGGYDNWSSLPDVLTGKIADAYGYYLEHLGAASLKETGRAISVLASGLWSDKDQLLKRIMERGEAEPLKRGLLAFCGSENKYMQRCALNALRFIQFPATVEELFRYLSILTDYVNQNASIPMVVSIHELPRGKEAASYKGGSRLTDKAFAVICDRVEKKEIQSIRGYSELLTEVLQAVVCHGPGQPLPRLFALARERRAQVLACNPQGNGGLHGSDSFLARQLQQLVLGDPDRPEEEKRSVQEHILRTDLDWAMRLRGGRRTYVDYSLNDTASIKMPKTRTGEEKAIIAYLHGRLKALDLEE